MSSNPAKTSGRGTRNRTWKARKPPGSVRTATARRASWRSARKHRKRPALRRAQLALALVARKRIQQSRERFASKPRQKRDRARRGLRGIAARPHLKAGSLHQKVALPALHESAPVSVDLPLVRHPGSGVSTRTPNEQEPSARRRKRRTAGVGVTTQARALRHTTERAFRKSRKRLPRCRMSCVGKACRHCQRLEPPWHALLEWHAEEHLGNTSPDPRILA